MDGHTHTRKEAGIGQVMDQFEVRTELVIDRVIKGNVEPGKHKLLFGFGVTWAKNGKDVYSGTSTEIPGDVDDVTKPNLWFLSPARSWDSADTTSYLRVRTYRCIQPTTLETYYRTLIRTDRDNAIGDLLDGPEKEIVARSLRFINGERDPWPISSFLDDVIYKGERKRKVLPQHAARLVAAMDRMPEAQRPYAAAVYSSLLGPDSVPQMRKWVGDKDAMVRGIAVGVLARFRDSASVDVFRTAVTGLSDGSVACAIITELDTWGDERLVPVLISFLQNDSNAGMFGDDIFVPALKAKRALLRITGYGFPFDVRSSLACWDDARRIDGKAPRKQYLFRHLGSDKPPFKAQVVGGKRAAIVVTNVSGRAEEIERLPDWICARLSSAPWDYTTSGNRGPSVTFVSVAPGGSIRFPLRLDEAFLLSEPKSRIIQLLYLQNGNKQGRNAWIGTISPTFGLRCCR
jgi:hypothetical protein